MSTIKEILAADCSQLSQISVEKILRVIQDQDYQNKKTHIVATMGPAVTCSDTVADLIDSGMLFYVAPEVS